MFKSPVKILPLCLLFACAFASCVKDKGAVCDEPPGPGPGPLPAAGEVVMAFVYDHNMGREDRFAAEVDHVDLFVFDGQGALHTTRAIPAASLGEGNTFSLELPEGSYSVVAWGNTHHDTYTFNGGTSISEMTLRHVYGPGGVIAGHPEHLFHGMTDIEHVADDNDTDVTVRMYKNTSRVDVVFEGIEADDMLRWGEVVEIWLHGSNAVYGFDRQLLECEFLKYLPEYSAEGPQASFTVHRILPDGDMSLVSVQNGYERSLIYASLPALIEESYEGDDFPDYLEREDLFTLTLKVKKLQDGAYSVVSVRVNDWNPIEWDNVGIG